LLAKLDTHGCVGERDRSVRRGVPALRWTMRLRQGTLVRFDSVTELTAFCRRRYQTDNVHCDSDTGEFLLRVDPRDGRAFESLIVHFEGEGTYAVLLPDP